MESTIVSHKISSSNDKSENSIPNRRSSLQVNLSFTSNLSEPNNKSCHESGDNESFDDENSTKKKNMEQFNLKKANIVLTDIAISQIDDLSKLKDEILNKTQQLKDAELLLKTKKVLLKKNKSVEISMLDYSNNLTRCKIYLEPSTSSCMPSHENTASVTPKVTNSRKSNSLKRRLFSKEDDYPESPQKTNISPNKQSKNQSEDDSLDIENQKVECSPILSCAHTLSRKRISRSFKSMNSLDQPLISSSFIQQKSPGLKQTDPNVSEVKQLSMEITTSEGRILNSVAKIDSNQLENGADESIMSLKVNTSVDKMTDECVENSDPSDIVAEQNNFKLLVSEEESSKTSSLRVNTSIDIIGSTSNDKNVISSSDGNDCKNLPTKKGFIKRRGVQARKLIHPCLANNDVIFKKPDDSYEKKNTEKDNLLNSKSIKNDKNNVAIVYRTRHRYPSIYKNMTDQGLTLNTVVIDSPSEDEPSFRNDSEVIPESFHESEMDTAKKKTPKVESPLTRRHKRKLFRQNSGVLSLSPVNIQIIPTHPIRNVTQKKNKRLNAKNRKYGKNRSIISRETTMNSITDSSYKNNTDDKKVKRKVKIQEDVENKHDTDLMTSDEDESDEEKKNKRQIKSKRKVVSKKIVINKRFPGLDALEKLRKNFESDGSTQSKRESSNDFQTQKIVSQKTIKRSKKIVIVATGFSKGDKSLIKSVINTLGSANMEENVTKYTTHVVSTGIRTVNLLRAIIRGCWLVSMEWILSSLENKAWLDPTNYEMVHYSKAVKNNRRDRQSFGNGYIPDLFIACGPIYVEQKTNPPTRIIKELIKTAGGEITEDPFRAKVVVGSEGVKEGWVLDSITTGIIQPMNEYERKRKDSQT